MRHHDLIFFHDFHEVHHNLCQINISDIRCPIFLHKFLNILIKSGVIRFSLKFSQCQHCILDFADILKCYAFHGLTDQLPVSLREPAHHSHIDPDYLSALDPYIAGMRICMKKAILDHLPDKIIYELTSDLVQIISILKKLLFVIDCNAVNILHDQYMCCRIFPVQDRYFYKSDALVLFGKF